MKLKWALAELARYEKEPLVLKGEADLSKSLMARKKEIIEATPVEIEGIIMLEGNQQYFVDLNLKLTLTLPSSRSLTPVSYEMNTNLTEIYLAPNLSKNAIEDLDDQIVFSLEKDIIDLRKPIEDIILASIPMKILSKEEIETDKRPKGKNWELFIEGDKLPEKEQETSVPKNNPFGVLKDLDLFNEDGDEN